MRTRVPDAGHRDVGRIAACRDVRRVVDEARLGEAVGARSAAAGADETLRPAEALEVGEAGGLVREPGGELAERAGVVAARDR